MKQYGLVCLSIVVMVSLTCAPEEEPPYETENGGGFENDVTMDEFATQICETKFGCDGVEPSLQELADCVADFSANAYYMCTEWAEAPAQDCLNGCLNGATCGDFELLWAFWMEGCEDCVEEAIYNECMTCELDCYSMDMKPNIYIYPEETTQVEVLLGFPNGGGVTVSEPEYGDGWNVTVTAEGLIDGEYTYLFYEALAPFVYQQEAGWVIAQNNLPSFFQNNLAQVGFSSNEIADFVNHWIPRLNNCEEYQIYPQYSANIEQVITLSITPPPDRVLRYRYVVACDPKITTLPQPVAQNTFDRIGYFAAEWGVILK